MEPVYPHTWDALSLVKSMRLELYLTIEDLAKWQELDTQSKEQALHYGVTLLLDELRIDERCEDMIGAILFENEAAAASRVSKDLLALIDTLKDEMGRAHFSGVQEIPSELLANSKLLWAEMNKNGSPRISE